MLEWTTGIGRRKWRSVTFTILVIPVLLFAGGCASTSATVSPVPTQAESESTKPAQPQSQSSTEAQSESSTATQSQSSTEAQPQSSGPTQSQTPEAVQPQSQPQSSSAAESSSSGAGGQAMPATPPAGPQTDQQKAETTQRGGIDKPEQKDAGELGQERARAGTTGARQAQGKTAAPPSTGAAAQSQGVQTGGVPAGSDDSQGEIARVPPGGLTEDERTTALEVHFQHTLENFDQRLQREQGELQSLDEQRAGSMQNRGGGQGSSGGPGEVSDSDRNEGRDGGTLPAAASSGGGQIMHQPSTDAGDNGGGIQADLPHAEDISDAQDDDVVARQLREAAEKEPDPELREKLWEEYRKYKASL